jgi:cytosine/adenosine deaminase-related metal-dependent hydrolase
MILRGGRVATGPESAERLDLGIKDSRLCLPARDCAGPIEDCTGLLILPGLINAHDHLEFNLFPRLGCGPYPNATAWARDIYRPDADPVRRHLSTPKSARLRWGGLKNLLSGVTTVMHHNPYDAVFDDDFPVRVVRRYGWAHSPAFSPDLGKAFRATPPDVPFIIHAGEGTDSCAAAEIQALDAQGALALNTVVVHGVGMDALDVQLMARRGASLIWCPTSNLFLLGRTLSNDVLDAGIPMALGTDSALTAAGDMADELAAAAGTVGWPRAYRMVTADAAAILRLQNGEGEIRDGGIADLLLLRDRGKTPAAALDDLSPELVIVGGTPRLVSCQTAGRIGDAMDDHWGRLELEGRGAWRVNARVPECGVGLRLAGRQVA